MTYCLTPVPHALGTPDGFMAKTVKSKMVSVLLKDVSCEINNELDHGSILFIEHGNARLYVLTDIPETFKHISLKLLNQLPQHGDVIFSTDMYLRDSLKCQERQRRGCEDTLLIEGINTRRPADFKSFLKNDLNKRRLFALMHKVWRRAAAASNLKNRSVFLVVEGKAFKLTSDDGVATSEEEVHIIQSDQEETDTRIVLYIQYAQDQGYDKVVVKCQDSDVFFILLYYAHTFTIPILLERSGGQMINISDTAQELGNDYCNGLLGVHVFTGEDTT